MWSFTQITRGRGRLATHRERERDCRRRRYVFNPLDIVQMPTGMAESSGRSSAQNENPPLCRAYPHISSMTRILPQVVPPFWGCTNMDNDATVWFEQEASPADTTMRDDDRIYTGEAKRGRPHRNIFTIPPKYVAFMHSGRLHTPWLIPDCAQHTSGRFVTVTASHHHP